MISQDTISILILTFITICFACILSILFLTNYYYYKTIFLTNLKYQFIRQKLFILTFILASLIISFTIVDFKQEINKDTDFIQVYHIPNNNTAILEFTLNDNYNQIVTPNRTAYALHVQSDLANSIPIPYDSIRILNVYKGSIILTIGLNATNTSELNEWVSTIHQQTFNSTSLLRQTNTFYNLESVVTDNENAFNCFTTLCYEPSCSNTTTLCDGLTCSLLSNDSMNCGQCDNICPSGQCQNSQCLDFCQANNNYLKCADGTVCVSSVHNFNCICPPGYSGPDCTIDPCLAGGTNGNMKCNHNGMCNDTSLQGTYECICNSGYSGIHCEYDACLSSNGQSVYNSPLCSGLGICTTSNGGSQASCTCLPGYVMPNCSHTYCESNPCSNTQYGAVCINGLNNRYCSCPIGFSGVNCENTPCTSSSCNMNHSVCFMNQSLPSGYACNCSIGYNTDMTCSHSFCDLDPCLNGAKCNNTISGRICYDCPNGYSGTSCEITPCTITERCSNHGQCNIINNNNNNNPNYNCTCDLGYTTFNCSQTYCSVNNPCQHMDLGTICIDSIDTYYCICPNGYSGTQCEIDPCHSDTMTPEEHCSGRGQCNVDGHTFNCTCNNGYVGSTCECVGSCVSNICGDQTSTESSVCNNHGTCIVNPSNASLYSCMCDSGYTTTFSACDTNPCLSTTMSGVVNSPLCLNQGTCFVVDKSDFICECNLGYSGNLCQTNPCFNTTTNSSLCNNVGTCQISGSSHTCQCNPGYTGSSCNINACLGTTINSPLCNNAGTCSIHNNVVDGYYYSCACNAGYSSVSSYCDTNGCGSTQYNSIINSSICSYHGTCIVDTNTGHTCSCSGYSGTYCQINSCNNTSTNSSYCNFKGTCHSLSNGNYDCSCNPGFTTTYTYCDTNACGSTTGQLSVSNSNLCNHLGTCNIINGSSSSFTCNCGNTGYSGPTCSINPCNSTNSLAILNSPLCNNVGICTVGGSSYSCTCDSEFTGSTCNYNPCGSNSSSTTIANSSLCNGHGTCSVSGSNTYQCTCNNGYTTTYGQCDTNSCGSYTGQLSISNAAYCNHQGTCNVLTNGSPSCVCNTGYMTTSSFCDTNPCLSTTSPVVFDSPVCNLHGVCAVVGNDYDCVCDGSFGGTNCNLNPCGASLNTSYVPNSETCFYNGNCSVVDTSFECICKQGYSGEFCQITPCQSTLMSVSNSSLCSYHGTCGVQGSSYGCSCTSGYIGTTCATTVCASHPGICQNGGTCNVNFTTSPYYTCSCQPGYSGYNCSSSPCSTSNPCQNRGTCVVTPTNYQCNCYAGYLNSTNNCTTIIQNCPTTYNPCVNGGNCTNIIGNGTYTCTCPPTYVGPTCAAGPFTPAVNPPSNFLGSSSYVYSGSTNYGFPATPTSLAALIPINQSVTTLTYNAPNWCRFMPPPDATGQDPSVIPEPLQPIDVWNYYKANKTFPPLDAAHTAQVTVYLYYIEFNDTVYVQGVPINSKYWWDPFANSTTPSSFSRGLASNGTIPSAQGCTVDPGLRGLTQYLNGGPLSAAASAASSVPAANIDHDFYAYARAYRNMSLPQTKNPSSYCPFFDPFPRYPIWRDSMNSTFGAFTLSYASGNYLFENHGNPLWVETSGLDDIYKTCSIPYYAFVLPYSPTVSATNLLLLAQHMLPMPDDIVPNAFTIVNWLSSYSVQTSDPIAATPARSTGTYNSKLTIYFKQPGLQDYINSCGIVAADTPSPGTTTAFVDGHIVVGLTRLPNITNPHYSPTPDRYDSFCTPVYFGQVLTGFCTDCVASLYDSDGQIFDSNYDNLFPSNFPTDCIFGDCQDWPTYPQADPCNVCRAPDFTAAFNNDDQGWNPSVDPNTGYYYCGMSGPALPQFDGAYTFGFCAASNVPYQTFPDYTTFQTNYSYVFTDRHGNPFIGSLTFH